MTYVRRARASRIPRARLAYAIAATLTTLLAITAAATLALAARDPHMLDRHLIFFPDKDISQTPADVGLHYEDARFTTSDGVQLHGWFIPGVNPNNADTLLWFHGNAGNISHRLDNLLLLSRRLNINILIFDYRGYGNSHGKPSEPGLYADAEAALAYLRSRPDIDATRLTLFGRSLGCAVAVHLATRHPVKAVILESPFTSIDAMARHMRGGITSLIPTSWLIRSEFDSLSKIPNIHAPILIIHGDQDDIVPIQMARELYAAANHPKQFHPIPGAGHNNTVSIGGDPYFNAMKEFISTH